MERRNLVRKGLIVVIILLFIGVNVVPGISENIDESKNIETVDNIEHLPLQVTFIRPENGIYFYDHKILPFPVPLVVCGKITIEAEIEPISELDRVEYYINDGLHQTISAPPWFLIWSWGGIPFSKITFRLIAYDFYGNHASDEITIWTLFG